MCLIVEIFLTTKFLDVFNCVDLTTKDVFNCVDFKLQKMCLIVVLTTKDAGKMCLIV